MFPGGHMSLSAIGNGQYLDFASECKRQLYRNRYERSSNEQPS